MSPNDSTRPPRPRGAKTGSAAPATGLTIGLFAKHWTPGATKTRLAAAIGDHLAAAVSRSLVEATLDRLACFGREPLANQPPLRRVLAVTPSTQLDAFRQLANAHAASWRVVSQSDGDLGQRMHAFFAAADGPALLVGSDAPHFPEAAMRRAIDLLSTSRDRTAVLAPSEDGGYWLVGAAGGPPPIFDRMPWSEPTLFQETETRLTQRGWRPGVDYHRLAGCYDIDQLDDLVRLRRSLATGSFKGPLARLRDRLGDLLGPLDTPAANG